MVFRIDVSGWYWTPSNELRACIVATVNGKVAVMDAETLEEVQVDPDDVMVERPGSQS